MEFELGQTYSGYEFMAVLRHGANATEYRVRNTVACRDELLHAANAGAEAAVMRQARILARLAHPNIIAFYAAQPIEGRLAMSSERPGPATLADRLREGPLDWREALEIAAQVLAAMGFLHAQGVAHLAITPDAIAFCVGVWKIAGFEAAQSIEGGIASSGSVNGNARYLAPEQVKGGTLDARTDLYSWGAVLYEMLCGGPPFESKSQFELLLAHVNQSPAPPSTRCARVPGALDEVVLRALRKDPAERYASAEEFAAALREAAERCAAVLEETVAAENIASAVVDEPTPAMAPETVAHGRGAPMIEPPLQPAVVAGAIELDVTCAADIEVQPALEAAVVVEEAVAHIAVPPQDSDRETAVSADCVEPDLAAETRVATVAEPCIEATVVVATANVLGASELEILAASAEPLIEATALPEVSESHLAVEIGAATAAEVSIEAVGVIEAEAAAAEPSNEWTTLPQVSEPNLPADAVIATAAELSTEPAVVVESEVLPTVAEPLVDAATPGQPSESHRTTVEIATAAELSVEAVGVIEPEVLAASAEALMDTATLAQPSEPQLAVESGAATAAELSIEAVGAIEPEVLIASAEPLIKAAGIVQTSEPYLAAAIEVATAAESSIGAVGVVQRDVFAASAEPLIDATTFAQTSEPHLPAVEIATATESANEVTPVAHSSLPPSEPVKTAELQVVEAVSTAPVARVAEQVCETALAVAPDSTQVSSQARLPIASAETVQEPTALAVTEPLSVTSTQSQNNVAPPPAQQPDPALQAALWAAAVAVASAASVTPAATPEPVSVVPVAAQLAPDAVTDTRFSLPVEPLQRPIPPPIRMPPSPPDAVHWIMFGSAAAFLGIVWVAIIFSMH